MKYGLELFALIASALTFMGGMVAWYSGAVQKRYAAQRDFDHLKNSYKQLADNQLTIIREMDQRFDQMFLEIKDLKALEMAMLAKVSGEHSTGWYRKSRDEG